MKTKLWVLLLILFFSEVSLAQKELRFQYYGVDDGLSQSSISGLFQDDQGYIWLNTSKGLNRFDGTSFKVYQTPRDTTQNGIVFHHTNNVIQDNEGYLWISSRNGLSKFDPRKELFANFKEYGDCSNCLQHPNIDGLIELGDHIYLGTRHGLSRIHKFNHTITSWPYIEGEENGPEKLAIREFEILDNGNLLIVSQAGLSIFDPTTENFVHIDSTHGLADDKIQTVLKDSKGRYWIGYETHGLGLLTGTWEAPQFKHFPAIPGKGPSHDFIFEMVEDKYGLLWIATYDGLTIFDPETETFSYHYHDPDNPTSIISNQIYNIIKDSNDRIWLATLSGLNVYDPYLNQFDFISSEKDNPQSLSANEIFALFEDSKGFIWIGNYTSGITVLKNNNDKKEYIHINYGESANSLSGKNVLGIEEDDQGRIWVATFNGVNIIDWPDRSSTNYTITQLDTGNVKNNPHLSMYTYFVKKDSTGIIWIGTHGAGLLSVDKNLQIKQYNYDKKPDGIAENIVITMEKDEQGRIWLGNNIMGIYVVENSKEQTLFERPIGSTILANLGIHDIQFEGPKKLLVSTGDGIYYFEDKEEMFTNNNAKYTQFTEETELSNNVVYDIRRTSNKEYWLSTGTGLSRLNTETNTVTPYTRIIGNTNLEFNKGASLLTTEGMMYIGGVNGVVYFDPDKIFTNSIAPKIHFSEFKILNEPVPISEVKNDRTVISKATPFLENITLKTRDKVFSLSIGSINFTLPKKTHYAYKLEGFDEDWTYTFDPKITRSNLDPGTYTLLAKAANNDGVWSDVISLNIQMLPPWYRTWWALVLLLALTISIVYVLLKLRLRQERQVEAARTQEREAFRKRSSRDFHDEAGTKITRISLITELARISSTENKEMQGYLSQIDDNLQDLNGGMRDFIWALDPSKDNMYEALARFTEFAGEFCEYGNIQFRSEDLIESLKSMELNMAERRHLLLILKEALNNCVKHGSPSLVDFKIRHTLGELTLILKDDGIGFDVDDPSSGNGLKNIRERAEALQGGLEIISKKNTGTTISLTLETTRLGN